MKYKFQKGDMVKHKVGGLKMIIISLSCYSDLDDEWWDQGDFWYEDAFSNKNRDIELGYLCRFFIPKSTEINFANANAYNRSSSTAIAQGEGSFETKNFLEYELLKISK